MEENYTLDKLFSNKIKGFENHEISCIENYTKEIEILKDCMNKSSCDEEITGYENEISSLEKKIKQKQKKINNYFLSNSNNLFGYFEMKQGIENNKNPKKTLDNFFNKRKKEDFAIYSKCNGNIEKYLKSNNYDLYSEIAKNDIPDASICGECSEGELIKSTYDGILICNKCFSITKYLIHNDKPAYKEPPKEISFYAYRRINHFKEILAQFQAKETTDIPIEIIQNIKNQIKKERISINTLTSKRTKEILKKLGYNKYYEHITYIKDKLGIKPPIMSQQLEETLCNLFVDIQTPYAKYCPSDRVNFLNYYYTLYKLCELLGETEYLPHFPMLKEQKKIEQDQIWRKICHELDWDFIPTL